MTRQSTDQSVYDTTIRLFILLMIIGWCLMLLYPFVSIMLWSLIIAVALHPLHTTLSTAIGGRPRLAAGMLILCLLVIVILPIGLLMGSLLDEVKAVKLSYDNGTLTIPPPAEQVKAWPVVGEKLHGIWLHASGDLEQFIVKYKDQLYGIAGKVAKGALAAASAVMQMTIALFIAGVLLAAGGVGESIRKFFRKAAGHRGDELADLVVKTVGTVVKGVLGEGLASALLHGIVLQLAGVPYAGIWTVLVFVLCITQLSTYLVSVPAMLYLFGTGDPLPAVAWSVMLLLASLSDNILTPLFLGKDAPVPMVVMFIGVIGGFVLSGIIGLFTGAIVMSLGYVLFVEWINSGTTEAPE